MTKTVVMLLTSVSLTACALFQPAGNDDQCSGTGMQPVNLQYGDSQLKADPALAKIKRGRNLVIMLTAIENPATDPPGVDYKDVLVKIEGKSGEPWLETSGSWNSTAPQHKLQICVPPSQTLGQYGYKVTIDEIGFLDPRVDVTL